jgi:NADH:ubiquinone oxidoreductase subunit C
MAEEMTTGTGTETVETNTGAEQQQQENRTFTLDEVNALLQSETDKRVTAALKTQQKKYEKQLSLSKLDGDERAKAEKDARIAELEEMLRDRDIANNKSELKSVLASRGLSAEFADIINITDDIEESQAKIDTLDKLFKAAVKAEVEKRLAATGGAPKGNGVAASETMTKEQFNKLPLSAQAEIYKTQPELYKKLTQ